MPEVIDSSTLAETPLFRDLSPAELSRLSSLLHRRTFPAGSTLLTAEQPGEAVYVIVSGTVRVHVEQADGTDVTLAILGSGELLGEMSVVDSLSRSASAVALEETTLVWMDRGAFWECLRTMPAMTFSLARLLSRRLRVANAQIEALAALDVFGRVARQILVFAREYGERTPRGDVVIPLRLTQNDLAGLVGASRVRVNQVLVTYKRHRYISVDDDHRFTVHSPEALARCC